MIFDEKKIFKISEEGKLGKFSLCSLITCDIYIIKHDF